MTLVSIKYTFVSDFILYPYEILILSHIRHGPEHFRKAFPLGSQQRLLQQGTVLSLRAPAMLGSPLFEGIDNALIEISDDEICHRLHLNSFNRYMIAMIASFGLAAINASISYACPQTKNYSTAQALTKDK
jgi:hypothetical protein